MQNVTSSIFNSSNIGILLTFISTGIAIYQVFDKIKVKKLYKDLQDATDSKYTERYEGLFNKGIQLINNLDMACQIVDKECVGHGEPCGRVSTSVNTAMSFGQEMASTFITMNKDYKKLYGHYVIKDLPRKLKRVPCVEVHNK
jgi:hypothetical protein